MNNDAVYKPLLDTLEEGVILLNLSNKIIYINPSLQKLLDIYVYSDLKIDDIFEVFIEDKKIESNVITGSPEIIINGVIFDKENLTLATKKGNNLIVSIKTIKNEELNKIGISSYLKIKDSSDKLELEKMKIDFSSQTVHILRTPITIINNNIDLIKKSEEFTVLSPRLKKHIEGIEFGSTELLQLFENLITVNEIENDKISLQLSEASINFVLERAIFELEEIKNKTGNDILILNPLYELPRIKLDVLKFITVFKGIITNSLKHTTNGKILIKLSKEQSYLNISIEDNGEGISETGLRFIFTKFYHIKKNALVMEQGLGIGLYYCKKIVEAHLGTIEIESKVGFGTTVKIKLKL
jgi:signal transduction histidine kinase